MCPGGTQEPGGNQRLAFPNREIVHAGAEDLYRSQAFADHGKQRVGPVHIIVRDGMVTLTGVVASEDERRTADLIARHAYGTWSVDNQLRLEK